MAYKMDRKEKINPGMGDIDIVRNRSDLKDNGEFEGFDFKFISDYDAI